MESVSLYVTFSKINVYAVGLKLCYSEFIVGPSASVPRSSLGLLSQHNNKSSKSELRLNTSEPYIRQIEP